MMEIKDIKDKVLKLYNEKKQIFVITIVHFCKIKSRVRSPA